MSSVPDVAEGGTKNVSVNALWSPSRVLGVFAWLSFAAEVLIIGTGGAVRLTGSGLGCPEWPLCTPESLVPTPEQGIHGIIEFGNRTVTGLVAIIAVVVLLLVLRSLGGRRSLFAALWFALGGIAAGFVGYAVASAAGLPGFPFFSAGLLPVVIVGAFYSLRITPLRRDLTSMAWVVLIGVVAQAFVGGITVLTGLNPFIVGFHYVVSLALVCVTAAFVVRLKSPAGPRELAVPRWFSLITHVTTFVVAVTISVGVLTTASGPHSGDLDAVRTGFNVELLEHLHAWPAYACFALTLVLVVASVARRLPVLRWAVALLVVELVQIALGLYQARNGLPEIAVGAHMILAALLAATMTVLVLRMKRPLTPAL